MKKTILTITLIISGLSFANNNPTEEKKTKDSVTTNVESNFKLNYSDVEKVLIVDISGNTDSTASVSITNQRGSSILFSLVESQEKELAFDLVKLEKGIYNVMYITNQEIRIKRLEVK
jgi:hypothetical protein